MINRLLFFLLMTVIMVSSLQAQKSIKFGENYYDDSKGTIYSREVTVDFKLHTNGFGLGVNIGELQTYYLTSFWNIELVEIKHPKEIRQSFDFQPTTNGKVSRAFIFGKQNNFYVLRGGFGQKRYFSEKAKRKGVAIGLSYEGGPSLGLLKPYYMELKYLEDQGIGNNDFVIRSEKFNEDNKDVFLDIGRIYGASSFAKGLSELSIIPGLHAKAALHFDWGAFDEFVKAVEAGIMVDFYFQNVPIMAENPGVVDAENRPLFINLFLNLQLGKRW